MGGLTDPVLGTWKGCRLTLGAGPARAEPATHGTRWCHVPHTQGVASWVSLGVGVFVGGQEVPSWRSDTVRVNESQDGHPLRGGRACGRTWQPGLGSQEGRCAMQECWGRGGWAGELAKGSRLGRGTHAGSARVSCGKGGGAVSSSLGAQEAMALTEFTTQTLKSPGPRT